MEDTNEKQKIDQNNSAPIDADVSEEDIAKAEEVDDSDQFNVGNVIAVISIAIVAIILLFLFVGGKKNKKKTESSELDRSGIKTATVDFKDKVQASDTAKPFVEAATEVEKYDDTTKEAEIPEELRLPESHAQPEPGVAPVSPVGSRTQSGSGSSRPDTRASRSPRKIEGIKGQENMTQSSIQKTLSPLTGQQNYQPPMTREEYIAQMTSKNSYPSINTNENYIGTAATAYQADRQNFFSSGQSVGAGRGQYLPYTSLWDGTVISGALVTAVNTDNPGVVIARVTENVWSSYDHSLLLIPEGTLLYATYNSSVSYGQNRVQVAWNRMIRPDGYRIELGNMGGVDAQGASGIKGSVNNHPWETLKALGMIAIYSMIQTEAVNEINDQDNEYIKNMMADVYAQAEKMGDKMIDRALDIKPTIKIKEGTEIKLITNIPLDLPPVEVPQAERKYIRTH